MRLDLLKAVLPLVIGGFIMTGCSDDGSVTEQADYAPVLEDISNDVIVDTYHRLAENASTMHNLILDLNASVTVENFEAAKQAWVDTREPWEQSEGFLFGPVDTEGIDPSIDSWPVNKTDLQLVLDSGDELTYTFVNSLEGTLKGFHTIEFLLWSADGSKQATDMTARELEYLVACSEVLASDTKALSDAWDPAEGGFVTNLMEAGEASSVYISQKAALEELANGILIIADEVGNGKINDPLEQEDLTLEESQFSDNSKTDFTNNIVSIQNIYTGVNGRGLTDVVSEENADLDTELKEKIQDAIDAIQAIPGTFTDAIPASSPTRPDAEAAQAKVRELQSVFEEKLIPLISNL